MTACRTMVRIRRGFDLRYLTAGNLARVGWPLARIAATCEVSPAEARAMIDDAIGETDARVRWCGARGCDSYIVGAVSRLTAMAAALDAARAAGWRFNGRGVLLCRHCAP